MIKKSDIREVVELQEARLTDADSGYRRDILSSIDTSLKSHALIISGIRRCGKSTLLRQLIDKINKNTFYLNFDTPRLYNFETGDFALVDELIRDAGAPFLFFDEIQVVDGWELFIRQKLDDGCRVVVTGSNASLMSRELGTRLTGRHITKELFPFSFGEFTGFTGSLHNEEALNEYLLTGGFPEFIKTRNTDIHHALTDDLIYRDIAVRHNIRDVRSLKQLLKYLASNVSNLVTATRLTKVLDVRSTATMMEYFSFFEQSYLLQFVPRFSWSYRVQLVNPRKIYFIDNGLLGGLTASFGVDAGRKLENMIFWELRRRMFDIYYFSENARECDFVICKDNKVRGVLQVCYNLNRENESRELDGLSEAMKAFDLNEGTIITLNQTDKIIHHEKQIQVIPAYTFATTHPFLN